MPPIATVVIDMLNPYDHEDADSLAEQAKDRIAAVADLIGRTTERDAELVFVNDNFGDFTATRDDLVERALGGRRPELVEPIVPPAAAQFVQKVRHSAFFSSALDYLLRDRGVETVILAGQVTEQCVLYSALDAYVRHFEVWVPEDAVIPILPDLGDAALRMMEGNMSARVDPVAELFD